MARTRRDQKVQLSFDGLNDAVTNLTGTLILVVVLILGVTSKVSSRAPVAPIPPRPSGEKPIGPLLQQIEILRLQTNAVDKEIHDLEEAIPALEAEVDRLLQRTKGDAVEVVPRTSIDQPAGTSLRAGPVEESEA